MLSSSYIEIIIPLLQLIYVIRISVGRILQIIIWQESMLFIKYFCDFLKCYYLRILKCYYNGIISDRTISELKFKVTSLFI